MIKIQTMLIMILHDFETYKLSYKYKILIKVLALIFCIITPDHRNPGLEIICT